MLNANMMFQREKLLKDIFIKNQYNTLNRPSDDQDITWVSTELKILQIDLVILKLITNILFSTIII